MLPRTFVYRVYWTYVHFLLVCTEDWNCNVTNYKPGRFIQSRGLSAQFCRAEVCHDVAGVSAQSVTRLRFKIWVRLSSCVQGLAQTHLQDPSWWRHPVACGSKTEVLLPYQLSAGTTFTFSRPPVFFTMWSPITKARNKESPSHESLLRFKPLLPGRVKSEESYCVIVTGSTHSQTGEDGSRSEITGHPFRCFKAPEGFRF